MVHDLCRGPCVTGQHEPGSPLGDHAPDRTKDGLYTAVLGSLQRQVAVGMSVGIHNDILSRPTPVSSFAASTRPDIARAVNARSIGRVRGSRGHGEGILASIVMMLVMAFGRRHRARRHA